MWWHTEGMTDGTCQVVIASPNGWRREPCGGNALVDGLCFQHWDQRRRHLVLRAYMVETPLDERMLRGLPAGVL